jgi:hypothetical protein
MAVTSTLYNHSASKFADGSFAEGDTYFVVLYNSFTPDLTATTKTLVDGDGTEVANGNGYTTGGQNLSSVSVTIVTTNDAKFDADNVSWTASGGDIGPATHAVVFNGTETNDPPVLVVDFDGAQTAGDGTDFNINWDADGIITFSVT